MKSSFFIFSTLLLASLLALHAAEPDFDATHGERAKSLRHDSLELKITLPKQSFFLGELIPVTFHFEDTKNTGKYQVWMGTYDRSGRIPSLKFFIEGPAGSYCDPLAAYFSVGAFFGGGLGNEAKLGRYEQVFHLNEWIRFDRPGKYRLYATSDRVSSIRGEGKRSVELVSPVISIEMRTPTAEELESTFREAASALAAASLELIRASDADAVYVALSRLRYLDTAASRRHLRYLLGAGGGARSLAMFGLIGTRETDAAIALLEEGIADPEVAITQQYFEALAQLRQTRANNKPAGPKSPGAPAAAGIQPATAWLKTDYFGDRADWKKLVEVFDRKTGRARAVCASSLFALVQNDLRQEKWEAEAKAKGSPYVSPRQNRLDQAAVLPKIRAPLAGAFLELTRDEQERLLRESWDLVRCPEFIPALKKIVENPAKRPDQSNYSGLQSLAVMRLAELDPAAGKPLILEDVRRLKPRYSVEALCSLPKEELKQELPLLAEHFAGRERVDTDKISGMISHIADDSVYDVVKRRYLEREGLWVCETQTHCLSYFIKVRRAEGLDLAFRSMTFRKKPYTHCYSFVGRDVFRKHYGPDVETRMLAALRGEAEFDVIVDLTDVLLRHGTEAVIDPLLDLIERLPPNADNGDYSYRSAAGVRRHVVEGLIYASAERSFHPDLTRWKLTPKQRERLKSDLASKREKELFQSWFKAD